MIRVKIELIVLSVLILRVSNLATSLAHERMCRKYKHIKGSEFRDKCDMKHHTLSFLFMATELFTS